ncbi:hypothetical protein WJX72_001880 [[Myrmecia] bisecta]|uniref:Uncharacterized protein n=1 Tax=[Myrmecia] bisecta TaxID=41462 RepID=A0AAW1QEC7_9CHLO
MGRIRLVDFDFAILLGSVHPFILASQNPNNKPSLLTASVNLHLYLNASPACDMEMLLYAIFLELPWSALMRALEDIPADPEDKERTVGEAKILWLVGATQIQSVEHEVMPLFCTGGSSILEPTPIKYSRFAPPAFMPASDSSGAAGAIQALLEKS